MTRIAPLLLLLCLTPQVAGGGGGPDMRMARELVQQGKILPLTTILDRLQQSHPGQVVEVELEYEDGVLVYEIDLITPQGHLIEVDMDAATGDILEVDEEEMDDG
ncbi:MAG: PepSY domain-containing protein [Paracoccus sp. (in: a-proteobacteria)]|uniref:PepSY domain-containing protein n=1 Tax=Paracoccus sp. TaxID=267 RepID=UPI0039E66859